MKFKRILALMLFIAIFLTLSACKGKEEGNIPENFRQSMRFVERIEIHSYPLFLEILNLRTLEPDQVQSAISSLDKSDSINNHAIHSADALNAMAEFLLAADFPILTDPSIIDRFTFYYVADANCNLFRVLYYIGDTEYCFIGGLGSNYSFNQEGVPTFIFLFYGELIPVYEYTYENSPYYDNYRAELYDGQQLLEIYISRSTPDAEIDLSLFTPWQDALANDR